MAGFKENIPVLLKQTQSKIIINQRLLTMCIELERNQVNQNTQSEDKIVKDLRHFFKLKNENKAIK